MPRFNPYYLFFGGAVSILLVVSGIVLWQSFGTTLPIPLISGPTIVPSVEALPLSGRVLDVDYLPLNNVYAVTTNDSKVTFLTTTDYTLGDQLQLLTTKANPSYPVQMLVRNDGQTFFTITSGGFLLEYDASTFTVNRSLFVANDLVKVVPSTNPALLVVLSGRSHLLTIINSYTFEIEAQFSVGGNPIDLAIDPVTSIAYVLDQEGGSVIVVSLENQSVLVRSAIAAVPTDISFSTARKGIVIADQEHGEVVVMSSLNNKVSQRVPLLDEIESIILNDDATMLYGLSRVGRMVRFNVNENMIDYEVTVGSSFAGTSGFHLFEKAQNDGDLFIGGGLDNNLYVVKNSFSR